MVVCNSSKLKGNFILVLFLLCTDHMNIKRGNMTYTIQAVLAWFRNFRILIEFYAEGEEDTTGLVQKFRNSDRILR